MTQKKREISLILTLLMLTTTILTLTIKPITASTANLTPTPSKLNPSVGEIFEVNININDVVDLYSWQIMLWFKKTVLTAIQVSEGPFLKTKGGTYFPPPNVVNNYNATHGYIFAGCTGTWDPTTGGASGSGVLCIIKFNGTTDGISKLVLSKKSGAGEPPYITYLEDPDAKPIPFDITITQVTIGTPPPPPPPPTIYISPPRIVDPTLTPSNTFPINISIANATNIASVEFKVGFNSSVLKVTNVQIGDLFPVGVTPTIEINNTLGYVRFLASLPHSQTLNGNGALAKITFHVENLGETEISLYETRLLDSEGAEIIHYTKNGYFSNMLIAKIRVDPPEIIDPTMLPPATFQINITIEDVENLYGYTFNLTYNADILTCLSVKINIVLGQTSFTTKVFIDDEVGFVWVKVTYKSPSVPITTYEPVAVATILFQVDAMGASPLHFEFTDLKDSVGQSIAHEAYDGFFLTLIRDVAITNITPLRTQAYEDWLVYINITVRNEGNLTETFNVTLYYDSNIIQTFKVVNLAPDEEITLSIPWFTKGVKPCHNYTIRGEAEHVPYELDIMDNTYTDGTIKIKIMGDVNGDGVVDISDIGLVGRAFGSNPDNPRWNPEADLNLDNVIDVRDISKAARNFGKTCP